jgi:hypothetical protein
MVDMKCYRRRYLIHFKLLCLNHCFSTRTVPNLYLKETINFVSFMYVVKCYWQQAVEAHRAARLRSSHIISGQPADR